MDELLGDAENRAEIAREFPKRSIHRRNTGYALDAPEFRDGARMTDLATIHDPALVPRAFLQALDLPDAAQDPEEALVQALGGAQLLLLVDNLEQVLPEAQGLKDCVRITAPVVAFSPT